MMELRIKGIERPVEFVSGGILNLVVENGRFFYKLLKSFYQKDEEHICVFDNGKILKSDKEIIFLDSFCDMSPNTRPALTAIYQRSDKMTLTPERRRALEDIQRSIFNLLSEISLDFAQLMEFTDQFGLGKMLQLADFRYRENSEASFCDDFILFLRAAIDSQSFHFIVTRDIFSFLNAEEVEKLRCELLSHDLFLLNLSGNVLKQDVNVVATRIIDASLCEF